MAVLLQELGRIMSNAANTEEVSFLQELKRIVIRCGATPGCKLKFIGD